MHELSIMENALAVAIEQSAGRIITRIDMAVGELTAVVPDALQFAFEVLSKGTAAESATLHVEHIPVSCHCATCDKDFIVNNFHYECPECQTVTTAIVQGQELHLISIEVR